MSLSLVNKLIRTYFKRCFLFPLRGREAPPLFLTRKNYTEGPSKEPMSYQKKPRLNKSKLLKAFGIIGCGRIAFNKTYDLTEVQAT